MKYLIILFLFVTAGLFAQQGKIAGKVLNHADNSPIQFATISIENKLISSQSDEDGKFILSGDIISEDVIIFSHIGFELQKIRVKDLNPVSLEIFLEAKILSSQTILVTGSIGKDKITPMSYSRLTARELKKSLVAQDIPEMLSYLPGITFYSENGNGIGYNYLSIRGFDQRRISVSVNGIPQNDPEDNNVYWLDFADILESTDLVQVQRGSGSGVIGYPAVGGSVNILTSSFSNLPSMEISTTLGSYNTRKHLLTYSSGLINNKYSFYTKLSQTLSDGYRNLSWSNLKSYHLSAVRYDENLTSQINIYGGIVEDGLAYTGIPKFAVKDRNLRRENYSYWEADDKGYSYTLERKPEELENFSQPHFELLNEFKVNENISLNSALFLVLGQGFFDYDASWADSNYFRLTKQNGFMNSKNPGNAIIRAMVENNQWGWIPRVKIKHQNGELILGSELRFHSSLHWGSISFAENLPADVTKNYKYYSYNGGKDIFNFFLHENYNLTDQINILAEAQLAYHKYKIENEKYVSNNFTISNWFINPRFGFNYKVNPDLNLYLAYARVAREPRLKNYYDAAESSGGEVPQFEQSSNGLYDYSKPLVKPEIMNSLELGSQLINNDVSLSANIYYMIFSDEIVKKGQVDRFGQPITGNMDKTVHYGAELSFDYKLNSNFNFVVNGNISKNYISQGMEYFKTKDALGNRIVKSINLESNSISGFPNFSFNTILKYSNNNMFAQLSVKYLGDFYSDNYGSSLNTLLKSYPTLTDYSDNKIDSYLIANMFASYNIEINSYVKSLKVFLQVNNILDNLYAAYAIGKEFFPAAERNFMIGVKLVL